VSRLKEAVKADLRAAGAPQQVIDKAGESIEKNFPRKTYELAVWFLGIATLILILGAVGAMLLGKATSEALWVAIGTGIGALAGIFTGKSDA
jgi:hypothetical protein